MNYISIILIPLIVLIVVIYGVKNKIDIYGSFLDGAKEGLSTTIKIFPSYVAMIFAVSIFLKSGFLEFALGWLKPLLLKASLPIEILPMAFVRSLSGTASLAILNDIFTFFGPDSFAGRLASTIMGSNDTTFYILTLYFGSVGIIKTKYAVKIGLFADFIGILVAFIVTFIFFG